MTLPSPDEQLARDLWEAVKKKDLARVSSLLSEGADPNHTLFWSPEWTSRSFYSPSLPPLHNACWQGDLSIVKALAEAGADCEREGGKYHERPIEAACRCDEKEVVQYLVEEKNISPAVQNREGKTLLEYALKECYSLKVALYLIDCGYGCGGDEEMARLLCEACFWGKIDVVKELVEKHNIDPNITCDDYGRTPLDRALDGSESSCCKVSLYLINRGCGGDEEKARLLCKACSQGEIDIVRGLVKAHKVDPNVARDDDGRTPLDRALDGSESSCCKVSLYLINRGCGGNEEKARLLCKACQNGKVDIVKELVQKHKVALNGINDSDGKTPLEIATEHDHAELVDYLKLPQTNRAGQKRTVSERQPSAAIRPTNKPETRRECPVCHETCHIRCKKCPGCASAFPPSKKNKATQENPLKDTASLLQKLQKKVDQLNQNGYDVAVLVHKFSGSANGRHNYRQYSTPGSGASFLDDTNVLESWRQHCSRRGLITYKSPPKRKRGGRSHDQAPRSHDQPSGSHDQPSGSHDQPSRSGDQDSGPAQSEEQRSRDEETASHDPQVSTSLPWPYYNPSLPHYAFPQQPNPGFLFPRPFINTPSSQYLI